MASCPTVLVVDADPGHRIALCEALADRGVLVREAADGQAALDAVHDGSPLDLVCADLAIPGISGFELCALIRAEPGLERLPVVAIGDGTSPDDVALAVGSGASLCLPKAPALHQLTALIAGILRARAGAAS